MKFFSQCDYYFTLQLKYNKIILDKGELWFKIGL